MHICIVGGGKVGFYLAKTLLEHGHEPVVIENDEVTCQRLANSLDISVIHGDGTLLEILRIARLEECSALIGVTGRDENNLIACQLAKQVFGVKKTVARVNNPKNAPVLKQLGVDIAVSSTDNIARLIEREVETDAIRQLMSVAGGDASLTEITLPDNFAFDGKSLAELYIPEDSVIIFITRGQELIIPRGNTALKSKDHVVCVARDTALHDLTTSWGLV
ncbi:MAG: NAD-binding protein [Pygmaiobacter sp.]